MIMRWLPHFQPLICCVPDKKGKKKKKGKGKQVPLLEKQSFLRNPNSWITEQNCHKTPFVGITLADGSVRQKDKEPGGHLYEVHVCFYTFRW